jgi:signal transduction histidine kinase
MPQPRAIRLETTSHGSSIPSFSDATCDRLARIVLDATSLDSKRGTPQHLTEAYQAVIESDEVFGTWDQQSSLDAELAESPVVTLARRLVQFRSWATGSQAAGPACATSAAAQRLLDTASLAVRLQALESNFARELAAQKQQAIYNFAYGLSHELNNPLANIATRAGVLAHGEPNKQRAAMLSAIVDNAMRGSEMLGDLMLVARPPTLNLASSSVEEFIDSIVHRASPWAESRGVTIAAEHGFAGNAHFDSTAMGEALWALVRNGIEAMFEGGLLTIASSVLHRPGRVCVIEVLDEGAGLTAAGLANCFDPYYSGREAGRGLGLGLSKAQRIVDLHSGRVTLSNRAVAGCMARIEFPS